MQASIRRWGGLPDVSEGSGGASLAGAFAAGALEIIDILYPDEGAIVSASSAPPGPTLNGLWGNSPTATLLSLQGSLSNQIPQLVLPLHLGSP